MEGNHECDVCFKRFLFSGQLMDHRRSHKGAVKPFKCDECPRSFATLENLEWHKNAYCRKNIFTCKTCGKDCRDAAMLSSHQRSHTGEKPFQCDSCPKAYANRSSLVNHKRTHSEKYFVCQICGWSSATPSRITQHKKSHEGTLKLYVCDECPAAFPAPSYLLRHQKIHSGEKPFQCIFCRKKFRRTSDLRAHKQRIHGCKCSPKLGTKCPLCLKYEQGSDIKEHVDVECQPLSEGLREFENESDIYSDLGESAHKQSVKNLHPEAVCAGEEPDKNSLGFEFVSADSDPLSDEPFEKCEGGDSVQVKEEVADGEN